MTIRNALIIQRYHELIFRFIMKIVIDMSMLRYSKLLIALAYHEFNISRKLLLQWSTLLLLFFHKKSILK